MVSVLSSKKSRKCIVGSVWYPFLGIFRSFSLLVFIVMTAASIIIVMAVLYRIAE